MEKKPHPIDTQLAGRLELQLGLPSPEDLTPLDQSLITPELATAFGIMPTTCSTKFPGEPGEPLKLFPGKGESEGGKVRRRADENSGEGGGGSDDCYSGGDESGSSNRAVKRPRLVWTPKLHKRFVEVIDQLGVDKAVPKTIMEVMNVEGLTRENVASHLQKYRMYLKKADGNSTEMNLNLNLNSNSSPISVSSTSTGGRASPSSAFESGNGGFKPIPPLPSGMHFNPMTMMPLPLPAMVVGPASSFGYGGGQLGVGAPGKAGFCGIESGGFNASLLWNRHGG